MTSPDMRAVLGQLRPGSHVCWVIDDDASYVDAAAEVLRTASARREKPVVFGPDTSEVRARLAPLADIVADPGVVFLHGGPLDASAMFAMFRDQTSIARAEGFERLVLVADMDWLLTVKATTDSIVAFELLLDRHVKELDATIVCAYRRGSLDPHLIAAAPCVHPINIVSDEPQFQLVATDRRTWRLTGELDFAVVPTFTAAVSGAFDDDGAVIDVSQLDFIDVAGMRAIVAAARRVPSASISLVGTSDIVRRSWEAAGFDNIAPTVLLVS